MMMIRPLLAGAAALAILAAPAMAGAQDAAAPGDNQERVPSGSGPPASGGHTAIPEAGAPFRMTPEQQQAHDTWPAQQRSDYDAWTSENQSYYWSLNQQQQRGYWAMTPDQRGMIYKMSPDQRAKAWQSIAAQMNGQVPPTPPDQANPPGTGTPTNGVPAPQTAGQAVPPAMPQDPNYQGGPYKGALTPPPATAMNKDYPVCTRKLQDNCRNPGGV
jgi:hypothetical protein